MKFNMWKKVFLSVSLIIILVIGIEVFNNYKEKSKENQVEENVVRNETEISKQYVTDDCLNEWKDYAITREEEIQETSETLNDSNKHYIIKIKDDFVSVYYINENDEEILYKVTDIGIEYLPDEDVENLKKGIDVYGVQNLNVFLEDFE